MFFTILRASRAAAVASLIFAAGAVDPESRGQQSGGVNRG